MYITYKERIAITMALGVGLSIILTCIVVLHAIGGLTCPPNVFC